MNFFEELKRRNVFRVGVAYVIVGWLLAQVADLMLENFGAPDWVMKTFLGFLIIGFPLAVLFAWAFELTPDGVKRESQVDRSQSIGPKTGRRLDRAIIIVLALALAWFAWDKFGSTTRQVVPAEVAGPVAVDIASKSVAVLPFVAMSSGEDDEYFADGLTEEILNSLAQLPELLVTARTSAFHFKGQDIPVQEIAATLGVRHIVEGSVRKSGQRLRVTAQLIRAGDGFHLWSKNYDSTSDDTIAVQEDIAEQIASAMDVVLDDDKREAMRKAGLRDVDAFIAYQKGVNLFEKAHGDENILGILREANAYFEQVIDLVPTFAPAYIDHSDLFIHILMHDASGLVSSDITQQDVETALSNAIDDYNAAVENAANPAQRFAAELDRAYITGNWRGLSGQIERVIDTPGCLQSNWIHTMAPFFDLSEEFLPKSTENRQCDPLRPQSWYMESRVALWSGNPGEALEIAREGDKIASDPWLNAALLMAMLENGEIDQAEEEIDTRFRTPTENLMAHVMLESVRGNGEAAGRYLDEYLQIPEAASFYALLMHAWRGDKQNANRLAAEIDPHPYGSSTLVTMLYWCACGAPWDIEATPIFASKIKESGVSWPPASPVNFPLKDW